MMKIKNDVQDGKRAALTDEPQRMTRVRARTMDKLMTTAMNMLENGKIPSITELACEAGVSRATAYRYFPTQSALISAIVSDVLAPMKAWKPKEKSVAERLESLLAFAYPQLERHEGALRAALRISLEQWAAQRSGEGEADMGPPLIRGNRKQLVELVAQPMKEKMPKAEWDRMKYAFSLIYGSEVFLVLKDIWGLESNQVLDVIQWMGKAIVRQSEEEAGLTQH